MNVVQGDCVAVMAAMEPNSVDAIVTDPPYGLEFMGKEWDRLDAQWSAKWNSGEDWTGRKRLRPGRLYNRTHHDTCQLCRKQKHQHDDAKCPDPQFERETHEATQMRRMQEWHYRWAAEALRVAKPGAHLLAFGGTRTYHRLTCALEDAGWEIRDCLVWAYASGFPKSLDVSKAIDKAAGAEREKVAVGNPVKRMIPGADQNRTGDWTKNNGREYQPGPELPATDAAKRWQGWGTALKPAWEPIVLARKPLVGTVAANVERYGTGALNIDGTRIGIAPGDEPKAGHRTANFGTMETVSGGNGSGGWEASSGRWPPNLLLTDAELFDVRNDGVVGSGAVTTNQAFRSDPMSKTRGSTTFGGGERRATLGPEYLGDTGGYARFFLVPKSSRSDREPDLPDYAIRLHRESGECDKLSAWGSEGQPLDGQTVTMSLERATSDEEGRSATSPSGKPPTGPSPTASRSTTSTATSRTTASRTSSSSTPPPTSDSTPAASSGTGSGGSPAMSAAPSSLWDEATGISANKDGRSTDAAGPVTSPSWSSRNRCVRCGKPLPRFSTHPTQKPTALMRHLVRLVTPPGGIVLDPFLGSGTTAVAAIEEGFAWIGIEIDPEYVRIAEARLNGVQIGMGLEAEAPRPTKTHPDLSKHQPKRRASAENYSGGWAGTEEPEGV